MFADYIYYKTTFKGTKIKTPEEYYYLANQADRYIIKFTNKVNKDTKDCECALSEYLQDVKKQGNISSESIPNAYSVSYGSNDKSTQMSTINSILELYLGNIYSSVGIVKVIN